MDSGTSVHAARCSQVMIEPSITVMTILCTDGVLKLHAYLTDTVEQKLNAELYKMKRCVNTTVNIIEFLKKINELNSILEKFVDCGVIYGDEGNSSEIEMPVKDSQSYTDINTGSDSMTENNAGLKSVDHKLQNELCLSSMINKNTAKWPTKRIPNDTIGVTSFHYKSKVKSKSQNTRIKVKQITDTKLRISSLQKRLPNDERGVSNADPHEFPFRCFLCKLQFVRRFSLVSHVRRAHYDARAITKPYQCSDCGRAFRLIHILCQHIYTHKPEADRPFPCLSHCNKTFSTKHQLRNHINSYQNIKPFSCGICNKACTSSAALKDHMVCHSADKPHLCSYCGEAFRRKSQLNRHLYSHTEKKFKCDQCTKDFVNQFDLTRHLVIHDINRVRHPCPYCSVTLSKLCHLSRHVNRKHPQAGTLRSGTT